MIVPSPQSILTQERLVTGLCRLLPTSLSSPGTNFASLPPVPCRQGASKRRYPTSWYRRGIWLVSGWCLASGSSVAEADAISVVDPSRTVNLFPPSASGQRWITPSGKSK
jgi:hypothetical protein